MTTGTWNSFGAGIEAEVVRRAHCSTARDQLAGGTGRRESRGQDWAAVSIALIACVPDRLVAHSNCEQHLLARLMKVELSSIFGLRRGDEMRHQIWNPLTWPPNRSGKEAVQDHEKQADRAWFRPVDKKIFERNLVLPNRTEGIRYLYRVGRQRALFKVR